MVLLLPSTRCSPPFPSCERVRAGEAFPWVAFEVAGEEDPISRLVISTDMRTRFRDSFFFHVYSLGGSSTGQRPYLLPFPFPASAFFFWWRPLFLGTPLIGEDEVLLSPYEDKSLPPFSPFSWIKEFFFLRSSSSFALAKALPFPAGTAFFLTPFPSFGKAPDCSPSLRILFYGLFGFPVHALRASGRTLSFSEGWSQAPPMTDRFSFRSFS